MDYDMEQYANSSANAPLTNGDLGLSDVQSLIQYRRVVPASKLDPRDPLLRARLHDGHGGAGFA